MTRHDVWQPVVGWKLAAEAGKWALLVGGIAFGIIAVIVTVGLVIGLAARLFWLAFTFAIGW